MFCRRPFRGFMGAQSHWPRRRRSHPRQPRRGAELHGAKRRKRAGFNGVGPVEHSAQEEDANLIEGTKEPI